MEDDDDTYYEKRLSMLKDMIQQDIYTNRADVLTGRISRESGNLLEFTLSKYLDKIERW